MNDILVETHLYTCLNLREIAIRTNPLLLTLFEVSVFLKLLVVRATRWFSRPMVRFTPGAAEMTAV